MAETDILNCVQGFDRTLQDSMNPNQGWQRTRTSTLAVAKPAFGQPWTRETSNGGHVYTLNFTRRNLAVTERLKMFYEQFEDDFFTLIDWDNGRHYVGRFTGEMPQSFVSNGRYSSTGWKFEEIPGCPMVQYPQEWYRWGVVKRPFDGFGSPRVATNSANWTRPAAVANDVGFMVQPNQIQNLNPVGGDTLTFEYRGYGFRIWADQGPNYFGANLTVDGQFVTPLNINAAVEMGIQNVYENTSMPLDIHRVQIEMTGTKALTMDPLAILLDHFEVMR